MKQSQALDTVLTAGVTRLAPSPTGALHLGNARTFLINWAMARQKNWHIILRMEDLDTPRVLIDADLLATKDLQWLGIDWDLQVSNQFSSLSVYQKSLDQLYAAGLIYPCRCTRKDIKESHAAMSAPHRDDPVSRYLGSCRPVQKRLDKNGRQALNQKTMLLKKKLSITAVLPSVALSKIANVNSEMRECAWRVYIADEAVKFVDAFAGPQSFNIQKTVGDFIVLSKAGLPAYQLAVVIDDARQQVTDIVRGDDLLDSAARQICLYKHLQIPAHPRYWHLPLVVSSDGRRLAKRHGDMRITFFREAGVDVTRVIGLLAYWSGIGCRPTAMTALAFLNLFDLAKMPKDVAVFTKEQYKWLMQDV